MISALIVGARAEAATCKPASAPAKEAAWQAYRARFPFLMQGIARMHAEPGCTVIVLGEPPPTLKLDELLGHIDAAEAPAAVMTRKHSFGGDGWTKDAIFTIDSSAEDETISLIHQQIFGTSFRAWTIDLDAPAPQVPKLPLNLQITPSDLRGWLLSSNLAFTSVVGGGPRSARRLIDAGAPGVYQSASPDLVAWVIDVRQLPVIDTLDARQFAMASDLVLGATLAEDRLVIIARSRIAPFELMPPLRTETLKLLADTQNDLAQSYERNSPLAGIADGDPQKLTSWAPVFLSPELIDTELGSLLNIADQILKGDSSAGTTRYVGFTYPDPPRWPFGKTSAPQPVMDALGVNTLTYNWNTTDFATLLVTDRDAVLAFRATGALPLDYVPDVPTQASTDASEVGRAYFAGLSDPTLVRAVQYNALYQAFRLGHMLRSATSIQPLAANTPHTNTVASAAVEDATVAMVTAFAHASDETLKKATAEAFDIIAAQDPSVLPDMKPVTIQRVLAARHGDPFEGASDESLRTLAKQWISPASASSLDELSQIEVCKALRLYMQRLVDVTGLRATYQKDHPEPAARWEHTSSWVMSTHAMLMGGTNWDFDYKLEEQPKSARRWQNVLPSNQQPVTAHLIGGWSSTPHTADHEILRAYGASKDLHVVRLVRDDVHYSMSFGDRPQVFPIMTLADAQDALAGVMRTQEQNKPIHINLERFGDEQVRAFRDYVDRISEKEARDIDVFVFSDKPTLQQARDLTRKQEFKGLQIDHVEPSLSEPHVVEANMMRPPGKLRRFVAAISVRFRDVVPESVRNKVKQIIEATCDKLDFSGSWKQLASRLNRKLKDALRRENIDGGTPEIANERRNPRVVDLAPVPVPGRI